MALDLKLERQPSYNDELEYAPRRQAVLNYTPEDGRQRASYFTLNGKPYNGAYNKQFTRNGEEFYTGARFNEYSKKLKVLTDPIDVSDDVPEPMPTADRPPRTFENFFVPENMIDGFSFTGDDALGGAGGVGRGIGLPFTASARNFMPNGLTLNPRPTFDNLEYSMGIRGSQGLVNQFDRTRQQVLNADGTVSVIEPPNTGNLVPANVLPQQPLVPVAQAPQQMVAPNTPRTLITGLSSTPSITRTAPRTPQAPVLQQLQGIPQILQSTAAPPATPSIGSTSRSFQRGSPAPPAAAPVAAPAAAPVVATPPPKAASGKARAASVSARASAANTFRRTNSFDRGQASSSVQDIPFVPNVSRVQGSRARSFISYYQARIQNSVNSKAGKPEMIIKREIAEEYNVSIQAVHEAFVGKTLKYP